MVIDPLFQDDSPDRREPCGQRLLVAGGDVDRVGEHRTAPLHVNEPGRPAEIEADLLWIEQMEAGHIVMAEAEVPETAGEFPRIHEQIGNDHHQRPLADRLGQLVKHLGEA